METQNYRAQIIEQNLEKLQKSECFKLICGASLTDCKVIKNLSFLYSLAGVAIIDVSPDYNSILAAKEGIELAKEKFNTGHKLFKHFNEPILMVSINAGEDSHFKTARIDYKLCNACQNCLSVCEFSAIAENTKDSKVNIDENICYGCGKCLSICPQTAITLEENIVNLEKLLTKLINESVVGIEIHAGNCQFEELKIFCDNLNQISEGALYKDIVFSFSLESSKYNRKELIQYVENVMDMMSKPPIFQIDGTPMSGNSLSGSSLQTLAAAQILNRQEISSYIMLAGGTNQETYAQANSLGVKYNGIAMGTFARKLVWPYLTGLSDEKILRKAIRITTKLVKPLEF